MTSTLHHCFVAHSFITYLVGRLVAKKLNLPRDNQAIICTRGFTPNPSDRDIAASFPLAIKGNDFPLYRKFFKGRAKMRDLDQRVEELIRHNPFHLYTFDTSTPYNQLIYGMKNCVGVSVIEEGVASYNDVAILQRLFRWPMPFRDRVLARLNYSKRLNRRGFLEPGTDVYCLFEDAFPGAVRKQVVFDATCVREVCQQQASDIPPGSDILVHDWSSNDRFREYSALLIHTLERMRITSLYQKFHPAQTPESQEAIVDMMERAGISSTTLPMSTPLEHYVFDDNEYQFIGYESSILFYAKRMGKRVKSVFDFDWGSLIEPAEKTFTARGWLH